MNEKSNHLKNTQPTENPELQKAVAEYLKLDQDIKEINKEKREIRLICKEKHGTLVSAFMHEVRMQKLDADERMNHEQACETLKAQLGINLEDMIAKQFSGSEDPLEAAKAQKARDKKVA